ncbi:DUF4956 domain-containing protein [Larkinella sp. VNQ87]|uniref:DUF4956 domain-containing protein n=1 Tax=Larkinella sp. VNQ87 TaxID=3400921 RepID=UPI003BFEE64A
MQHLSAPEARNLTELPDDLFIRLGLDLCSVGILIRLIYYRMYRKTDLFLTFFTFNLIIFLITFLLNQVQLSIGAAFGLFAVFSMLRYRTEGLSARDMTYLFMVIAVGLISSVSQGSWHKLALINGLILSMVQLLEGNWLFKREFSKTVFYDRADLIVPNKRMELLLDLEERTGLEIHRIEIQTIDFMKDSAQIILYYYQNDVNHESVKSLTGTPLR